MQFVSEMKYYENKRIERIIDKIKKEDAEALKEEPETLLIERARNGFEKHRYEYDKIEKDMCARGKLTRKNPWADISFTRPLKK
jgi:hypothetical protein